MAQDGTAQDDTAQDDTAHETPRADFTSPEMGALAHLYRGEVYRSTIWRTRLDTTTNWAVVTLGVALSITFSSREASPVPLVLVGVLILLFLVLEARRYRYFNVWRARSRWMERHFYAPMLHDGDLHLERNWQEVLARDYIRPRYHITMLTAVGRRIRRNYIWILMIQTAAYAGKVVVHPVAISNWQELWSRMSIGPVDGRLVLAAGLAYVGLWIGVALWTALADTRRHAGKTAADSMG